METPLSHTELEELNFENPDIQFLLGLENPYEIFQYCESACLSTLLTLVTAFQEPYYEYLKTNTPDYNKIGDGFERLCDKIFNLNDSQEQAETSLYWIQAVSFALADFFEDPKFANLYDISIKQELDMVRYDSRSDNEHGYLLFSNISSLMNVIEMLITAQTYSSPQYQRLYDQLGEIPQTEIVQKYDWQWRSLKHGTLMSFLSKQDVFTRAMVPRHRDLNEPINFQPPEKRCINLTNNQLAITILKHFELVDRSVSQFLTWEKYSESLANLSYRKKQKLKANFCENFRKNWVIKQKQGGPWSFLYSDRSKRQSTTTNSDFNGNFIPESPTKLEESPNIETNLYDQEKLLVSQDEQDVSEQYTYTPYTANTREKALDSLPALELEKVAKTYLSDCVSTFWNINMNGNIPKTHRAFMRNLLGYCIEKLIAGEIFPGNIVEHLESISATPAKCPDFLKTKVFDRGRMKFVGLGNATRAIKYNVSKGARVVVYHSEQNQFGIKYMTGSEYHDNRKL